MTWGFSRQVNAVYLTFDDGPDPLVTPWVLDELKRNNAKATFFCVGNQVRKYPELFERIKQEGHSVGNHTMNHENGRKTKTKDYLDSISEANEWISSGLFRPPYGSMTTKQSKDVSDAGYKIIMWSWLTYDFDEKVETTEIIRSAQQVSPGDIVVLHDNPKCIERLKLILPEIISIIHQKGYQLKAID
jgi:peptidoglycan/xylan/chitin deacetylase (PgdA/CDA1 family)